MINESPDKLKLKNRAYPWYLGTTFFVYKTPTGKTNYVSSTSSGIDFTLKVNGMDFSKFVPVEMRTQLDHENLVEVLHSLNEKLINKNESRRSFVASGRLWKINSQNYVSFWNEKTNVQKSILDKLMVYLNITYDNTLFEFPSNQNDYKPYDQIGTTSTITKDIDLTPHLDAPMLPAAYAKELRRLKSMNELTRKQWQDSQSTGLGDPDHPVNDDNPHTNKLKAENAEMAQSDITKIIDYSEKLQSMFTVNDNLEDWVKAKLNHACDYVTTVRDYLKFYRDERKSIDELLNEIREIEKKYKNTDSLIDTIQYALDIVGLEPTIGSVADGTNAIISLLRAALEKEKDKKKQHLLNSAISGVSVIPFGDLAKLIKLRMLRKPTVKLLKLVKNYLKTSNPSYTDELFEKWSNTYKKSINCSNPRGFSQKAHCRARQLRKADKVTKSKPVRESYKIAISELLKEQDSSMAMGALKQLNNDAKELESMLQPNAQLEDWVKAKLNLAGEYLDDVYHHLDHFGPQGRKLDEMLKELDYEGGIGFHEFVVFYQKANDQQLASMEDCLKNSNMECVKDLIQKVTGMTMDKIKEAVMNPNFKLNMMNLKNLPQDELEKLILAKQNAKKSPTIIKYGFWIDTDGKIIKVDDHEKWAKEKYPYSANPKLEAFKNGYVRMVYDDTTNQYEFQNMDNGSWKPEGNSVLGIPKVNSKIKLSIMQFMKDKNMMKEASWQGEEERSQNLERQRSMSWSTDTKIWITPKGTVEVVKYQKHEDWIKHNDSSLLGYGPDATYLNAIKKGYIKGSIQYGMMSLSNLENYNFSLRGGGDTPPVSTKIKDALVKFIEENNIRIISSGGAGRSFFDKHTLEPIGSKLPDDLDESTENSVSDEEITKKYIQYAKNTIKYLEILKAIKDKFRKKADIGTAIRLAVEKQNIDPNYITLSSVKGILIGLGERNDFTNLSPSDRVVAVKLQSLSSVALTHNDGILIKILDLLESDHMNEDLKKTLGSIGLAGLTALGSLGIGKSQAAPVAKPQIVKTATNSSVKSDEVKLLNGKISDYIAHWEGKFNKMYLDTEKKPTIGIGHYLNNTPEDRNLFKSLFGTTVDYDKVLKGTQSLDNNQVEKLFNVDVKLKEKLASKKISGFSSFPQYIKNAIINALYRGDLGPKTIGLINKGDWKAASEEYLNHKNAKSGPTQIIRRMKTNALAFNNYAQQSGQIKEISLA